MQIFQLHCGGCGKWFEALEIAEITYGKFLLRSSSGEMRYSNPNMDNVFTEVSEIIGQSERVRSVDKSQRAEILDKVFGSTCDPDSQGNEFIVGQSPPCPHCNAHQVIERKAAKPVKYVNVNVNVQPVTHQAWRSLSKTDRENRIRESLSTALQNQRNQS